MTTTVQQSNALNPADEPPRGEPQRTRWFYQRAELWRRVAEREALTPTGGGRPDPAVISALCDLARLNLDFMQVAAGDPVAEALGNVAEQLMDIEETLAGRKKARR